MKDLRPPELAMLATLALALLWLGLFPGAVLNASGRALRELAPRTAVEAGILPGNAGSGAAAAGGGS
jgi:NADH:ubiquinone oxidoreductase subunit 4 (subunit M)